MVKLASQLQNRRLVAAGLKRIVQYISLGIVGELTFHRLYNVKALRPILKEVGLLWVSPWIPVELKPVGDC